MAHSVSTAPRGVQIDTPSTSPREADAPTFKHAPLVDRFDWLKLQLLPNETMTRIMQWTFAGEPPKDSIGRLGQFREAAKVENDYTQAMGLFLEAGNTAAWLGSASLRGHWLVHRLNDPDVMEKQISTCVASLADRANSIVIPVHLVPAHKRQGLLEALTSDWPGLEALAVSAVGSFTAANVLLSALPDLVRAHPRLTRSRYRSGARLPGPVPRRGTVPQARSSAG